MSNTVLRNKQGSVVAVQSDMILVRYEGKGVLFRKNVMTRTYRNDEIVQFSARKASTLDKEVGDFLHLQSRYEIEWLGTEIKFIKMGRMLRGEGIVLNIPDTQYMFVDWRFSPEMAPKATIVNGRSNPTNVFVTRATVRPEVENMREMFKSGDRVKYVAREQAPNERGVCWRTVVATDQYHEIVVDTPTAVCRNNFKVIPKSGVAPPLPSLPSSSSSSTSNSNSVSSPAPQKSARPKTPVPKSKTIDPCFEIQKPPPVDGFDYFDVSNEACAARFRKFAETYRTQHPACLFSKTSFDGFLKLKYLQQLTDELAAMQAVEG